MFSYPLLQYHMKHHTEKVWVLRREHGNDSSLQLIDESQSLQNQRKKERETKRYTIL